MKPQHQIYIASKGRSAQCQTVIDLIVDGVQVNLVVEPQEFRKYWMVFGEAENVSLIKLPEDNKGITFARNFILDRARQLGFRRFWMLDDDIKQGYMVENGKCIKSPLYAVLYKAEQVLGPVPNLAVGALEYQQYAWAQKKPLTMNSYCDVAVLIDVEATKDINYRPNCKEDRDFVLQALSLGYSSARSCWTAMSVPKNGSNKGGLHDAYKDGLERHWSKRMEELWPGVCERRFKSDGRPDVKINWKLFKRSL